MDAQGTTPFEQAVAHVYTSRLGLGGGAFHLGDVPAGPAETVFLGVFRKEALAAVGRLRRVDVARSGLGAELPAAALGPARVVLPGTAGHLPSPLARVAIWPGRCSRPAAGGARWSADIPTRPAFAISLRPSPLPAIGAGTLGAARPRAAALGGCRSGFLAPAGYARRRAGGHGGGARLVCRSAARAWLPVVLGRHPPELGSRLPRRPSARRLQIDTMS